MNIWSHNRTHHPVGIPVQQGFSIVELLVAVAISIVLLMGMVQMLVNNQNTYRMQTGLALLQENGRFGMDFMATDIRLAGNQGCSPLALIGGVTQPVAALPLVMDSLLSFTPDTIVDGYETAYQAADLDSLPAAVASDWTPNLHASLVALNPVTGSDIVAVRYVDSAAVSVNTDTSASADITLANNINDIQVDDIVVISDCKSFDSQSTLFRVSSVAAGAGVPPDITISHGASHNSSGNLKRDYLVQHSPEVGHLRVNVYFIENTTRKNEAGINILALSRYTLLGGSSEATLTGTLVKEELLTGVENLQIQYGIDGGTTSTTSTRTRVNRYATADEITDWSSVISVRISMLVNTVENMGLKPDSYTFEGTTYTPVAPDYLLRREFVSTASIRQRTRELKF